VCRQVGRKIERLDGDSVDLVEIVMAMEEKGMKADTVGDLMRFLDEMKY
jgi:hypothetical protein